MQVKRVSVEDDLEAISKDINNACWDEQNEMDDDGFKEEDIRTCIIAVLCGGKILPIVSNG